MFSPHFDPPMPLPTMPKVNHPFLFAYWSPHEVIADERPVPTDKTLAIHPLSGAPLLNPFGKKMVSTNTFLHETLLLCTRSIFLFLTHRDCRLQRK